MYLSRIIINKFVGLLILLINFDMMTQFVAQIVRWRKVTICHTVEPLAFFFLTMSQFLSQIVWHMQKQEEKKPFSQKEVRQCDKFSHPTNIFVGNFFRTM
jgi:hypothetical protein